MDLTNLNNDFKKQILVLSRTSSLLSEILSKATKLPANYWMGKAAKESVAEVDNLTQDEIDSIIKKLNSQCEELIELQKLTNKKDEQ